MREAGKGREMEGPIGVKMVGGAKVKVDRGGERREWKKKLERGEKEGKEGKGR